MPIRDWFRAPRPRTSRPLRARGTGSWRAFREPSHFVQKLLEQSGDKCCLIRVLLFFLFLYYFIWVGAVLAVKVFACKNLGHRRKRLRNSGLYHSNLFIHYYLNFKVDNKVTDIRFVKVTIPNCTRLLSFFSFLFVVCSFFILLHTQTNRCFVICLQL